MNKAQNDSALHSFMNAGIGLSATSRCGYCMGTAATHPDMQKVLAFIESAGPKLIGGATTQANRDIKAIEG